MKFLPDAFKTLENVNQFIIYKLIPSKTRAGKNDKIPVNAVTLLPTNAHDRANWLSAAEAITIAGTLGEPYGVGFCLTAKDPYWFLDIDDCFIENKWSKLAINLCTLFDGAAVEISSSGKGLHILGTGEIKNDHANKNKENNLEFYTEGRFIALTSRGAKGDISRDFTLTLATFLTNYFNYGNSYSVESEWTTAACAEWNGTLDDEVLIGRMLRSRSGKAAFGGTATFQDLWEANYEVLAEVYNNDESSYDAALAQHLAFWTGNNCERMLTLMKQSALIREKWERQDYLRRTILSACKKQTVWLKDKPLEINKTILKPQVVTGTTFLSVEQQMEFFAGCSYVCDAHKILIPGGYLLKPDQFKVMYGGYSFVMDAQNERVSRNAWEAFTESQAFRSPKADSICFRPDLEPGALIKNDGRTLANVWYPVTTSRIAGDITPFMTHLEKVFPVERDRLIILCYMAAIIQYKGIKFQWAPCIQGVEGNGKTLFTRCVAFAIGDRYTHFPKAAEIATKFNDWMFAKIFIGVEDIYIADAKTEIIEALKPMITSDRLEIEAKGAAKVTLNVCCNFMINTNHKEGLRKTRNDRRFAPFYTAQQTEADLIRDGMTHDYFYNLYQWLRSGGYANVAEFLYTYSIADEFNPATKCQRAPITSSTDAAILHGLGGVEQEILEAIGQGVLGFRGGWVSSMALDRLLEKLNAKRFLPHNKRRELLQALGFEYHAGLKDGRVNNVVMPDGGKPRLFIKQWHVHGQETNGAKIAELYSDAQIKTPH